MCSACAEKLLKDAEQSRSTFVLTSEDAEALGRRIQIQIDGESALGLIATIQLACRHPKFDCATRAFVERFARDLQQEIAQTRNVALLLEAGWSEKFDTSKFHLGEENRGGQQ